MRTHVNVLGWLFIIVNGLHLMGGFLLLLGFTGIGFLASAAGAFPALPIMGGIGAFLFVIMAIVYIPGMIVGWGLLNFAPWARILGIIVSVIECLHPPVLTLLGIYGLVILFNSETADLFDRGGY